MNTETLKTFITLAEKRNYTQTANYLFVAQSTVTNRIFDLEKELGHTLFIRSHKQLQLTAEGNHFLEYARRMAELEQSALISLSNLEHRRHSIRIGTANTIYDCHLARKLLHYHNNHGESCLSIVIDHSLPLIQMLQDHVIDLAFTYIPYSKNGIRCSIFATDSLSLVTSVKNSEYSSGIRKEDLTEIPYYYCDFNFQDLGSYIKNLFPANHPFPLTLDRSANLLAFILNGTGYTFLPQSMVRPLIQNGTLLEIPLLDFSIPPVSCYLQYKKNPPANTIAEEFLKEIML